MKKKIIKFIKSTVTNKKRLVVIILIVGTVTFLLIRNNNSEPEVINQTATVKRETIVSSITASGTVISSNIENVTTQASGTITKVYVNDGDEVVVGQKLAEIDLDVQGEQNYASAYSTYINAQSSLNAANNNYRKTQASLAVVYDEIQGHDDDESLETKEDRTNAEVANDNAYDSVKSAEAKLYSTSVSFKTASPTITSPSSGTIKSVTIAEGMNIGATETSSGARANQRIATIGTEGLPIATFDVSEIDVSQIKPGQKTTIILDSIPDKTFTGKVVSVDRVGTITSNVTTYPVIVQIDTKSEQILPNMAATANIIVKTKSDVLTVPPAAINYQGETASMKVIKKNQEINQTVELGISSDTAIEILSGANEGDVVIIGTTTSTQSSGESKSGSIFPVGGSSGGGMKIR